MTTVAELLSVLQMEIDTLQGHFLHRWIPACPEHSPEDFQHDVKAYCVLAHAAYEEFIEELSLIVVESARQAWLGKKYSPATIGILLAYKAKLTIDDDERVTQKKTHDQIRDCIDNAVSSHSNILKNNHGFSLKYMRTILTPIGIDIPNSVRHQESLRELAGARGSYAHSIAKLAKYGEWKSADRPMTPEGAKNAVSDCFELCSLLANKAAEIVSMAI